MQKYDIIFLGRSSFTEDLHYYFLNHLKTILIENNSIPIDFSSEFFPKFTFLPQEKSKEESLGYVITDSFRFELNSNSIITKIFLEEIFENISQLFDKILFDASIQLNYLNDIIIENFDKTPKQFLFKNLKLILKDFKNIRETFSKYTSIDNKFVNFLSNIGNAFAPAEKNSYLYEKYIIFSLLNKKTFTINCPQFTKRSENDTKIKEIRFENNLWKIFFEDDDQLLEAKFLVSTIPPHILSLSNVVHPFKVDYDKIFYEYSFYEPLKIPTDFPEYVVYEKGKDIWYFVKKDCELLIFKKGILPNPDNDKKIFSEIIYDLLPHLETIPEYKCVPHIFVAYDRKPKKRLNLDKNIFFTKNLEYPFYGSDGEVLYRNKLKETIWKKLL